VRKTSLTLFVSLTALCCIVLAGEPEVIDYPSDYRSWQHVKTAVLQSGHPLEEIFGGIHHIYANAQAMEGLTGGEYKDGAVLVFDLLDYQVADHTLTEGDRKRIDVMQFDRDQFSDTGGWGFGSFVGNSKTERVEQNPATACFQCHVPQEDSNYVYSQYRP
jgi:hypothetical protein